MVTFGFLIGVVAAIGTRAPVDCDVGLILVRWATVEELQAGRGTERRYSFRFFLVV